jgi:hypothetical protein
MVWTYVLVVQRWGDKLRPPLWRASSDRGPGGDVFTAERVHPRRRHPANDLLGRRDDRYRLRVGTADYTARGSRFTGKINWVQIDLGGDDHDPSSTPTNASASLWPAGRSADTCFAAGRLGAPEGKTVLWGPRALRHEHQCLILG